MTNARACILHFIIAAADGLPPLRQVFVICGIFVDARSFFDSTAF